MLIKKKVDWLSAYIFHEKKHAVYEKNKIKKTITHEFDHRLTNINF